ncbi:hypothetical protein LCGC14_2269580 [marine sediment metagenome]|uniref:Uncharacterized protein n=1 Tax=marine sediment metagenome TaxID=412755 RepID=A0A0F9CXN1_9ZZZZ
MMYGNDEWIAWVLGQNYSGGIESYNQWKKTLEDLEARKLAEKIKSGANNRREK